GERPARRGPRRRGVGGRGGGGRPRRAVPGPGGGRGGGGRYAARRHDPPYETTVRRLDASTSDVRSGRPVGVEAHATVLGAASQNLEVTGSVGPVVDADTPGLTPVDLRLRTSDLDATALPGVAPALDVAAPPDLSVAGTVGMRAHVQGTIGQPSVEGTLDASSAEVRLGKRFLKRSDIPLVVEAHGTRDGDAMVVRGGALRLAGVTADVTGTIHPGTPTMVDVKLDSNRAGLADLAALAPGIG